MKIRGFDKQKIGKTGWMMKLALLCCGIAAAGCTWDESLYNTFVENDDVQVCPPGNFSVQPSNENDEIVVDMDSIVCYPGTWMFLTKKLSNLFSTEVCESCEWSSVISNEQKSVFKVMLWKDVSSYVNSEPGEVKCPVKCFSYEYRADIARCIEYSKYYTKQKNYEDKLNNEKNSGRIMPDITFVRNELNDRDDHHSYEDIAIDNNICPTEYSSCLFDESTGEFGCVRTCEAPMVMCDGKCINPDNDDLHCGAKGDCLGADPNEVDYYGDVCSNGKVCQKGSCSCPANSGMVECNGQCIYKNVFEYDKNNCGGCSIDLYGRVISDNICADDEICNAGKCTKNPCYTEITKEDEEGISTTSILVNEEGSCYYHGICMNEKNRCGNDCTDCMAGDYIKDAQCVHEPTKLEGGEEGSESKYTSDDYCVVKECMTGAHLDETGESPRCVVDTVDACGSPENDCKNIDHLPKVETAVDVSAVDCVSRQCVVNRCATGYHPNEDRSMCEEDGSENCGGSGVVCTTGNIAGSTSVSCTEAGFYGVCRATACSPGYQLVDGKCIACGAGTFSAGGAATTCTDCPANQYSGAAAGSCTACPAGTSSTAKAASCTALNCNTSQYIDGNACQSSNASNCGKKGLVCEKTTGVDAVTCSSNSCVATKCVAGYYLSGGKCLACAAGTYAGAGATKCTDCAKNQYSGVAAGSCTACPAGTSSAAKAATCTALNCDEKKHINGNICEDNSTTNCGAHGKACTKAAGSTGADCTYGVCNQTGCSAGYTLKMSNGVATCVKNS